MISERLKYMHYCDDITKIEGYAKAIASSERYVIHHKREVQNGVQIWTEEAKEKLRNTLAKQEVKEKMYTPERNRKIANSRLGNKYPRVASI